MKISTTDLLEHSFVISIDEGRLRQFNALFTTHGICQPLPTLWTGIKDTSKTGYVNCWLSHRTAIQRAKDLDWPFVCIFEDDAYPRNGIKDYLEYYLQDVPEKCNVLILGYYQLFEFTRYNQRLFNHAACWGSHAYIVFKRGYDKALKMVDKYIVCDCYQYVDNAIISKDEVFVTNKNLFIQFSQKKSMTNYIGYLWRINNKVLSNEEIFKRGYSPIENVLGDVNQNYVFEQRKESPIQESFKNIVVFGCFIGPKYNQTSKIIEWYKSLNEYYAVDCNRTFVIYTNNSQVKKSINRSDVEFVDVNSNANDCRRPFKYIQDYMLKNNRQFDYLCFVQSNARCKKHILLNDFTQGKDFAICRHVDFNGKNFGSIYPMEKNKGISCDISSKNVCNWTYVQISNFSATREILVELCDFINKFTEIDMKNNKVAYFQDETYLNFYLNTTIMQQKSNLLNIADGWTYCHPWYKKQFDCKVHLLEEK